MKFEVAAKGWPLFDQTFVFVIVFVFVFAIVIVIAPSLILVSRLKFEVAAVGIVAKSEK